MKTEDILLSAHKNSPSKIDAKIADRSSCSERSDRFISASKSVKAFQESLRLYEIFQNKSENHISPLKKKLSFPKSDAFCDNDNQKIFLVDIKKKIKKVESPFKKIDHIMKSESKQEVCQTHLLVSSFNSIPQKIQELFQSSVQIEKAIPNDYQQEQFKNLTLKIQEMISVVKNQQDLIDFQDLSADKIKCVKIEEQSFLSEERDKQQSSIIKELNQAIYDELFQNIVKESSLNKNSSNEHSLSQTIRLRKKNKKKLIRKQKKQNIKNMKLKLQGLVQFVDSLHEKNVHSNRQSLIMEMSQHLSEKKFGRLRNQLKKLI